MVRFLTLIAFLLSLNSFAIYQPTNIITQTGGPASVGNLLVNLVSNISALRMLGAGSASGTANNYYMLVNYGTVLPGAQQYKVTTGKTMYCYSYEISTSTAGKFMFGYGTAALGSEDTATPPTGSTTYNATGDPTKSAIAVDAGTVGTYITQPIMISFAQDVYPYVKTSAGGDWHLKVNCIEQ